MVMRKLPDAEVHHFDRETFINEVWDYKAGEHVTVLAPTGGGKTHLAFQLLGATSRPELPAVVYVLKPRDETVDKFTVKHKFLTVRAWPPPRMRIWEKKPNGYVLWPLESDNPELDDYRHAEIFKKATRALYRKGNRIIFADETYSLENELGLKTELRRVWTKGRSMGTGLWAASQRPVYISMWAYQANHLFLANDPDTAALKRLSEIGAGIDPKIIEAELTKLERYHFLYINRDERAMCVVGP
jgi:hypothetical protein